MSADRDAAALIESVRKKLAGVDERIRGHPYIRALERKEISDEALRGFAGHQYYIIGSDLRSVAMLINRHGTLPGRTFLAGLFQGESAAFDALLGFAGELGLDEDWLRSYEPRPGGVAYPHYVAWLGAYGSDAELAAAFLVNFAAWGGNCGAMGRALEANYGIPSDKLEFFRLFAETPPSFENDALDVVAGGLARGVPQERIARAARLLQDYELTYWDTMHEL